MKHYVKPMTAVPKQTEPDEVPAAFDVTALLDKGGLILSREIKNLLMASASGKLLPAHSRDLVAYIRLLSELKEKQEADASEMTDEELLAAAAKK